MWEFGARVVPSPPRPPATPAMSVAPCCPRLAVRRFAISRARPTARVVRRALTILAAVAAGATAGACGRVNSPTEPSDDTPRFTTAPSGGASGGRADAAVVDSVAGRRQPTKGQTPIWW
ncbi:hypothetical protein tb265_12150 [Gemmatimonadetes bacterium T265]|nr:hypothetical protein tb265_12150 [Gemmatimonadetes bacterium T265]